MVNIIIIQCTLSSKNYFPAKVGRDKSQPSQKVPLGLQGTAASTPLVSLQLPKVFFLVVKIFDCLCSAIKAKRKKWRKEGGISSSGSLRNLDSRHKTKVHTKWKIGSVKIATSDLQQVLFLHFKTWLRVMPIPFVEFQVWGFKISQTFNSELIRSMETLVSFEIEWRQAIKNDIIWYKL